MVEIQRTAVPRKAVVELDSFLVADVTAHIKARPVVAACRRYLVLLQYPLAQNGVDPVGVHAVGHARNKPLLVGILAGVGDGLAL